MSYDKRLRVGVKVAITKHTFGKIDKKIFGFIEFINEDNETAIVVNHYDDSKYNRKLQDLKFISGKKWKKPRSYFKIK